MQLLLLHWHVKLGIYIQYLFQKEKNWLPLPKTQPPAPHTQTHKAETLWGHAYSSPTSDILRCLYNVPVIQCKGSVHFLLAVTSVMKYLDVRSVYAVRRQHSFSTSQPGKGNRWTRKSQRGCESDFRDKNHFKWLSELSLNPLCHLRESLL